MARLSDADRGQILLVAAFALAVTFVALSVIVNGAIYTQNLATRGETASSGDALHYRAQVEESVERLLEYANEHNNTGTSPTDRWGNVRSNVSAAVNGTDDVIARQQAVHGRAVNVSFVGQTNGTLITNSTSTFENTTGAANWTVTNDDVNLTRAFDINVTDTDALEDLSSDPFVVNVTTGADRWRLFVGGNSTGENVTIKTIDADGEVDTCSQIVTDDQVTINVTTGKLGGRPCPALDFGEGLSDSDPYTIVFNNSNNIEGAYSLVIGPEDEGAGADSSVPNFATSVQDVAYSVTVHYTYETPLLLYEADIRVAPGEPDD